MEFCVIPGADGELGILPGHAPLIAQVKPGSLHITINGERSKYVIAAGFAEVTPTVITLMTTLVRKA